MTEQFIEEIVKEYLPPLSLRSNFTSSRLAILKDHTTKPVLTLLAEKKFGEWNRDDAFPFWIDGDPTNETLSNVALAQRAKSFRLRPKPEGRGIDVRQRLEELLEKGRAM